MLSGHEDPLVDAIVHEAMGLPRPPGIDPVVLDRSVREHSGWVERERPSDGLWVESANDTGGPYTVSVGYGEELSFTLTNARALRYGQTVIGIASAADFDGAVIRKFREIGVGLQSCVDVARRLNGRRPPVDNRATAPLVFTAGCSKKLEPFVRIHHGKTEVGQLTCAAALDHGLAVVQAFTQVTSDNYLLQVVTEHIGLTPMQGRRLVFELHDQHRQYRVVPNPDAVDYRDWKGGDGDA